MINREPLQIIKRQKKTRAGAYIPLENTAWAMIDDGAEHAADEKVFSLTYTRRTYAELRAWGEAAGLSKEITWHLARKTFATQALENKADIYTVAKLLGHKSFSQVARYANVTDSLKRDAVARLPSPEGGGQAGGSLVVPVI
jgi:site-specific recombinase XerD